MTAQHLKAVKPKFAMLVTSSPTTAALPSQKGLPRLVQMSYPMEPWSVGRHCSQISHASWSILLMTWLMFIIVKEKDMLMSSLTFWKRKCDGVGGDVQES